MFSHDRFYPDSMSGQITIVVFGAFMYDVSDPNPANLQCSSHVHVKMFDIPCANLLLFCAGRQRFKAVVTKAVSESSDSSSGSIVKSVQSAVSFVVCLSCLMM